MGFWDWLTGKKPEQPHEDAPLLPAPPTNEEILASLGRTETRAMQEAPAIVSSRVSRVAQLIRDTLPRVGDAGLQSVDTYSIVATATDYLPEALDGYLRLPRDWADSRPIERGKTSLMLLVEQLDLLSVTMDKIYDAINTRDAAALITHGRFLTERFGTQTQLNLDVADRSPAPANPLDL